MEEPQNVRKSTNESDVPTSHLVWGLNNVRKVDPLQTFSNAPKDFGILVADADDGVVAAFGIEDASEEGLHAGVQGAGGEVHVRGDRRGRVASAGV